MKRSSRTGLLCIFILPVLLCMQASAVLALTETIQKNRLTTPSLIKKNQRIPVQPAAQVQFPLVVAVNPATVFQGQTATLMISGRDLKNGMGLKLGSGIDVGPVSLLSDTGSIATAQITVAPDAAPGSRAISVLFRDELRQTGAALTVNSLYQPPLLFNAVPNTFFQGRTYTVVLTGQNLGGVSSFDMGPGIQVTKKQPDIPQNQSVMVEVTVSASASPGQRIIRISDSQGTSDSRASVSVMQGAVSPAASGKQIARPSVSTAPGTVSEIQSSGSEHISPGLWYAGRAYHVMIFSEELEKGMFLDLGQGIQIAETRFRRKGITELDIVISTDAQPGARTLKYKKIPKSAWTDTTLKGTVFRAVSVAAAAPPGIQKIIPLPEFEYTRTKIELKTPEFGKFMMMENWEADHGIPTTDDAIVFTWQEKAPQLSQWFELRILDRDDKILISRKIEGAPESYYEPDIQFISQMFDALRPQGSSSEPQDSPQMTSVMPTLKVSGSIQGSLSQSGKPAVTDIYDSRIDCYWQVAGFRRYGASLFEALSSKGNTGHVVEVAISDKWPLQLPEFSPTGLLCSSANTPLTPSKYNENIGERVEDNNFYIGDTLELYGKISIDGCPWSVKYDTKWHHVSIGPAAGSYQVTGWSFSNLIVDWGDGTWDFAIAAPTEQMYAAGAISPGAENSDPPDTNGAPVGKLNISMMHTYRYAQKFPIRLFVLPEDEMGSIDAIVQANKAVKGKEVLQTGARVEQRILLAGSGMIVSDAPPDFSVSAVPSVTAGFQSLGKNAFLLYCNPMVVDIKADPAATGKLHLINIDISGFSGQGLDPDAPVDVSGLLNKPGRTSLPKKEKGSSKLTVTQASPALESMTPTQTSLTGQLFPTGNDAVASSCDEALYAMAQLEYFGLGRINLVWKVDGVEIARTLEDVGPSPVRQDLNENNEYTEDILHGYTTFVSPKLPLDIGGKSYQQFQVTVEAGVEGYENVSYLPPVDQEIGGVHLHLPGSDEYFRYVGRQSLPKTYLVKAPDTDMPCAFKFPVKDGKYFIVSNIQNRVTKKNGKYSGQGTLYFSLPDGPYAMSEYAVEIAISSWAVSEDQVVTQGQISQAGIGLALDNLPGLSGVLKKIEGISGQALKATLDLKVSDTGLHRVGAGTPPEWTGVQADLVPDDGWYAEGLSLAETEIFWSDFRISSNDVRLDLSRLRGKKPESQLQMSMAAAGSGVNFSTGSRADTFSGRPQKSSSKSKKSASKNSGPQYSNSVNTPKFSQTGGMQIMAQAWSGINLGENARVYPFLFDLEDIHVPAKGWSITSDGIQGRAASGKFEHVLGDGSISFDGINITAGSQMLDAEYKNVQLNIPWPAVSLSGGDASIHYERGQDHSDLALNFDTQNKTVTETYDNVKMTAGIKGVERLGSGWGITTDTTFDFNDSRNPFVKVVLTDLFFNVFGEAHFPGNNTQAHNRLIPVSQSTTLGDAEYGINGLKVFAPADKSMEERLSFTFSGEIRMNDFFNADTVDVMYHIQKPLGKSTVCKGPTHAAIHLASTYPNDADPLVKIDVRPNIVMAGNSGTADAYTPLQFLGDFLAAPAFASGSVQDTFRGTVDSEMFGGADLGVKADFRYGTHNGKSYWLTHINSANLDVPIFSGVNLKGVNGGMGQGFSQNVFEGNPMTAIPDSPDMTLYSAGITIGSPGAANPGIYKLAGQLTVAPEDNIYRMGFQDVRVFGIKLGGGYFEYDNSVFKGNLWGGLSLYGGIISMNIPKDSDRVGLYFDSGEWEIWAGRKETPLELKLLNMASTNGYYQIGSKTGYRVGGGMSFSTGKLCMGIFAGEAWADAQMGMAITPGTLEGYFWIDAGARAILPCSGGLSAGVSQSIKVNVTAPPLDMKASIKIDLPDMVPGVPDNVTFNFNI